MKLGIGIKHRPSPLTPLPLETGERNKKITSIYLSPAGEGKQKSPPSPVPSGRGVGGESGFTLLELLIVIFIIAIIVSISVMALGDMGKNRKAGYFAQQLKSTLAYTQQYAVIQPTTVIFELRDNHYEFKTLQMIAHDDGSISYRWNILNIPGTPDNEIPDYVTLQMDSQNDHSIQINSSGTITPFSLHIGVSGENSYYMLSGNAAGALTLVKQSGDNS